MSSKSLKNLVGVSRELLMEVKLEPERPGSQELTHVLKYFWGIKVFVTSPKSMWGLSKMMKQDWIAQYISLLEPIIDKLWSTLMMEYSKEHGMKITSTSACVELDLQGSPRAPISLYMIFDPLKTSPSTERIQWRTSLVSKDQKMSQPLSQAGLSQKSWTQLKDVINLWGAKSSIE